MDLSLVLQIVGGLLVIFLCVATYFNTKAWRWPHVTMMFLNIVMIFVFLCYASLVHKTKRQWQGEYTKGAKRVDELDKQIQSTNFGVGSNEGLFNLRERMKREIIDRGRVWPGLAAAAAADGTVTLTAPASPTGEVKKLGMVEKTVVHGFLERIEGNLRIPFFYMGEFQATAVTDTTVTLVATLPQSALQKQQLGQAGATWALYEVAPPDAHEPFAGLTAEQLAVLMPQDISGQTPEQYQAMIQEYVRTGQRAEDSDLPDNIYIRVKFKQPYEIVVDAATTVSPLDDSHFDAEGKAQSGRLQRREDKGTVKFIAGSEGIFDSATAAKLIDEGVADKIEPIFRRQLHDYEGELQTVHKRLVDTMNRIAAITDATATVTAAQKSAEAQAELVTQVRTKLTADKAKVTEERDGIKRYATKLAEQVVVVRDQVNKLYRSNKALSQELMEISARLTDEINSRSQKEATALAKPAL